MAATPTVERDVDLKAGGSVAEAPRPTRRENDR